MPIGLNSVANSVVLICPLPAVHRCLSVGLFAQCCLPPVPSIPPPPFADYATLARPALFSHTALCLFLPAPAVVTVLWVLATFSTTSALQLPSCLASWLLLCA